EGVIDTGHIPSEIIRFNGPEKDSSMSPAQTETEEKQALVSILEKTDWNKAKAARLLGFSRPTLYRKLEKYGLEQDS
ncbi:MAG: helix-turn-helix domain-containing protein, partial [Desulfobacterales bacterium]|nr:helix-turn-helix domain-containing protein [Desulfobacterales bacterium]